MKRATWGMLLVATMAIAALATPAAANDPLYAPASILRGEAPEDCHQCREMTACAIVADMERGVRLRSRWYGWRSAREQDVALIERAQSTGMCRSYPACRFVGNGRDLEVWARRGWVSSGRVIAYCSAGGCSVCVPLSDAGYKAQ